MAEPQKQNFLHGATILTAGVVIIKILGAIYKIPLGNILGDEGYALFLAAYNIYNVGVNINMISTSEIRVTVIVDEGKAEVAMNAVHDAFMNLE